MNTRDFETLLMNENFMLSSSLDCLYLINNLKPEKDTKTCISWQIRCCFQGKGKAIGYFNHLKPKRHRDGHI